MSLEQILSGDITTVEPRDDIMSESIPLAGDMCCECEDQPASVQCTGCRDDLYCAVCFTHQHRKGSRLTHQVQVLVTAAQLAPQPIEPAVIIASEYIPLINTAPDSLQQGDFRSRATYIPLRLAYNERASLRLLEAALSVCEYTDKVDVLRYTGKTHRIVAQIKELCGVLSGLVVAKDYKLGQAMFETRAFADNQQFFQGMFELGRRHKIMNPDKMRDTYGKLVYMLQDAQDPQVKDMLEFACVSPLVTVHSTLLAGDCLNLLDDVMIESATAEIFDAGKKRNQVQYEIKSKENAIEFLARKYSSAKIDSETIKQCLYSIGDNNSFLRFLTC